jgi:NAD+ kinase
MTRRTIGFLIHPGEEPLVTAAIARADHHGFDVRTSANGAEAIVDAQGHELALLVAIGGDGTFLYGARLAAPHDIPLLGVNRGRLGFLTDVPPAELAAAIDAFAAGDFTTERRSTLSVSVAGAGSAPPLLDVIALNEAAVKAQGVNVVRIRVEADQELLGEFDCDGVVVATTTGSTAYALSAGGPPIDPRVPAVAVVPLAPHAVMTRAVIIPESSTLAIRAIRGRVSAAGDRRPEVSLPDGATVTVRPGPDLRVVRYPGAPTFLERLRTKLHFGTPLKGPDVAGTAAPPHRDG